MVRALRWVVLLLLTSAYADQERLNLAVTASFKPVIDMFADGFTAQTGIELRVSSASTGVLYQQILKGAPFDVFFAADRERPERLAQELGLPAEQLATYAYGRLVLVSQSPEVTQLSDLAGYTKKVIIANPLHAPYGLAAEQVLDAMNFNGTRVLASNVSQARQYLSLQLADVGLIAASVADGLNTVAYVDDELHSVIEQQLLVLTPSPEMTKLLAYLRSTEANSILESMGYLLPSYHDN